MAAPPQPLPAMTAATATAPLRTLADLPRPRGLPLIGNLLSIDPPRLHQVLEAWAAELPTPFLVKVAHLDIAVFTDPELSQTILRERPDRYRRPVNVEGVLAEMGANGVFSAEGAAWKPQRRLVMQALAATNFRSFHPTLQAITERLLRRWQRAADTGEVVEMTHDLVRYTVDVTCALVFGEDPNTLEQGEDVIQNHLALIFPSIMRRVSMPWPYWRYVKLPRDRALDKALAVVHRYVHDLIARARERRAAHPEQEPQNLLEGMLAEREKPDSGLTDEDVAANVLTLLLAGEDTTAHTLNWTLYFLAADRALQDRGFAEAQQVFGDARVCPQHEDVKHLDFFEALATEATRLKPIVPINSVQPLQDVVLGDVAIPAYTRIMFLNRPSMLDPTRFAQPQTYLPDRWLRNRGTPVEPHETRAYVQFGAGPRVCPGRYLAGVEIRQVLSMLLRNFTLELAVDRSQILEVMAFAMTPSRMPVRLTRRD